MTTVPLKIDDTLGTPLILNEETGLNKKWNK